jgi:hypothetical protein
MGITVLPRDNCNQAVETGSKFDALHFAALVMIFEQTRSGSGTLDHSNAQVMTETLGQCMLGIVYMHNDA